MTNKLLLLIGFMCASAVVQAQSPKDFFPNDYVNNPINKTRPSPFATPSASISSTVPSATPAKNESVTTTPKTEDTILASPSSSPHEAKRYENLPQLPLSKIKRIGAVLDGLQGSSTTDRFRSFLEFMASKKLEISTVYFVGPYSDLTMGEMIILQSLKGRQETVEEIPAHLKIARLPSWVIETEKGLVILEGLDSFEQFITNDGNLSLTR